MLQEIQDLQVPLAQLLLSQVRLVLRVLPPQLLVLLVLKEQLVQLDQREPLVIRVLQVLQDLQLAILLLHLQQMVMPGLTLLLVKHLSGMLMLMVDSGYKLVTL